VVPHWHVAGRAQYLTKCLDGLAKLPARRVTMIVITNDPVSTEAAMGESSNYAVSVLQSLDQISELAGPERAALVLPWKRCRNPLYMEWQHKAVLTAALENNSFSHFALVEDDILIEEHALNYWLLYRQTLATHGLLPGFVRVEHFNGREFVTDQKVKQRVNEIPHLWIDESDHQRTLFVAPANPHQGMFLMDRDLLAFHLTRSRGRSPLRSRVAGMGGHWGILERAAMGVMFDDVPPGFSSRSVVPLSLSTDGTCTIATECTVEHMPANYASDPHNLLGSLAVDEVFQHGGNSTVVH